jgi:hypothetical protein
VTLANGVTIFAPSGGGAPEIDAHAGCTPAAALVGVLLIVLDRRRRVA